MVPRILAAGDTALVVEFGETIDRDLSRRVAALDRLLLKSAIPGVLETVPTFRSLMVHYNPDQLDFEVLVRRVNHLVSGLVADQQVGRTCVLPVCYDDTMAPDIAMVAEAARLSRAQLIECHSATTYYIYMIGFLPGMAYMGDNPEELRLPRRETPRLKVPMGSLAIAMGMTSVFPQETPSGWHIIGRCPVPMREQGRLGEPLLRACDEVRFKPVSVPDYGRIRAVLSDPDVELTPETIDRASR